MRTITALLLAAMLLVATALPAFAGEVTVTIDHDPSERITSVDRTEDTDEIFISIVGDFLWIQYGKGDADFRSDSDNIVSVDVSDPDIVQAVVTTDKTVTLVRDAPEPEATEPPTTTTTTTPEVIDLVAQFPLVYFTAIR